MVFKLSGDLDHLLWSTFIGEDEPDIALGLRLDDLNNVYVTGIAGSSSFQTTFGTVQPNWNGGEEDAFVILLSADGQEMIHGTFWGTSGEDHSYFLDIDEDKNVHIYGQSTGEMPITPETYFYNANSPQFLTGLTSDLSSVVYSTVIGKNDNSSLYNFVPVAFTVDKCNHIYFSGYYAGNGLPTTPDAIETSANPFSFYIGVLDSLATDLSFGTYYGNADHVDGGTSRFDKGGILYQGVCSCTQAGTLNTLPNAYATFQSTFCDVGVFKIDFDVDVVIANGKAIPSANGCAPFTVDFEYTGNGATDLFWDFDDNGNTSSQLNPSHTFTSPGVYTVKQIATAVNTCNQTDTFYIPIHVFDENTEVTASANILPATNGYVPFTVEFEYTGQGAANLIWDFDDGHVGIGTNPTHTFLEGGEFEVMQVALAPAECIPNDTAFFTISVIDTINAVSNQNHSKNVKVFPNPAKSQFFIESDFQFSKIVIYNSIGQQVLVQTFQNQFNTSVNLNNTSPGIYFLKVITEKGFAFRKILIE